MILRKVIKLGLLTIGITCFGIFSAGGLATGQGAKFQDVIESAKKEIAQGNTFLVYSLAPREEKARKIFLDSFKKKYGLADFNAEWLMLHQNVSIPRVISEIKAGRYGPDIFEPSIVWALEAKRAGIIESFDWVGTFGRELPGIYEAADQRVLRELKGMMVLTQDATRSFIYNTTQLKAQELPNGIEDLINPKWARRFAIGGTTSPFDLFSLVWKEQRTLDIVTKLLNNRPIIVKGTPAVNNAVAAGQAAIGLGSIHDAVRLKMTKGAPVEWKSYGNLLPVLSQGFAVPTKARHPNLARLFIAWFATEGAPMYEELESQTRVTREGSHLLELIRQRTSDIKILEPKTQEELEFIESMREKLAKLLPSGQR